LKKSCRHNKINI